MKRITIIKRGRYFKHKLTQVLDELILLVVYATAGFGLVVSIEAWRLSI